MSARVAIMAALALCACEAVPDVVYTDGGAIVDGQVSDTNTCPSQVPPYATVCCGPIACTGTNCVATCSDCVARCGLLDLCCPNAQNRAVCKTNAQTCP